MRAKNLERHSTALLRHSRESGNPGLATSGCVVTPLSRGRRTDDTIPPASALDRARAAAAAVQDPELPALTIEDLGILRGVAIADDRVEVTITQTYSGCPATPVIAEDVRAAVQRAGFAKVRVRTVLSPAWNTGWITPEGHRKLREAGIAPPCGMAGEAAKPPCPHCGSAETELISAFGSTPCKALHRCLACREPFEAFKCH